VANDDQWFDRYLDESGQYQFAVVARATSHDRRR
jgi:hypothetical protein